MKGKFYAIVYLTMIIVVHLICAFIRRHLLLFPHKYRIIDMLSLISQCFRGRQRITLRYIFTFVYISIVKDTIIVTSK